MKKRCLLLILALLWLPLQPAVLGQTLPAKNGDIVILYENDVHGSIDGYPLMSALRDQMRALTPHVAVVSCGDFLSGTPLGSVSHGRYLVRMMNAVGYDYVTLGNHEFDFGIDTLARRMEELSATVLCGNFASLTDGVPYYLCHAVRQFGGVKVAFVGITTPTAPTSSTPMFFQDSMGHWLYTFYPTVLDSVVQHCVDEVRRQGAEHVVVLSHLGDIDLPHLVAATTGIDVVLDGHSHSVIPRTLLLNRDGGEVLWTSTGSNFKNIGRLVIPRDGKITCELLPTAAMPPATNAVADTLRAIRQAYDAVASRVVGHTPMRLWRKGCEGRRYDSPMGNFFSDAFLALTMNAGADMALMNSGGIRDEIRAGEIRFGDLYSAAPFDNQLCLVEMSGQSILDGLEMGCRLFPLVGGGFLQVSGIMFEIDSTLPSTVVCDENGVFVRVAGARRVKNVRVWDARTRQYRPLQPERTYRVAGCDYTLLRQGDGHRFPDVKIVDPAVCPYVEAVERYLRDYLGGIVGEYQYGHPQGRITVR